MVKQDMSFIMAAQQG